MSFGRYVDTPWGQNWLNIAEPVLEEADSGRLQRGLSYASGGRVGEPEFKPGSAVTTVRGSSSRRYRVAITLPGPEEISTRCDCPDPVYPCKHLVAVVFRIGRIIDEDPSVLRTLRAFDGYSADFPEADPEPAAEPDVPGAGRTRWATELAIDAIDPAEAFARSVAALPDAVAIPDAIGEPCYCPPQPGTGVDLEALESLAAVAAGTAMTALLEADIPEHQVSERPEDPGLDAARIAVHVTDPARLQTLAAAVGRTADQLAAEGLAWTFNGPEGLDVLTAQWQPDPGMKGPVAQALAALTGPDGSPARASKRMNRWTIDARDLQLRYGRDERWYPFWRRRGKWWPAGPAAADLTEAVDRLRSPEWGRVLSQIHL